MSASAGAACNWALILHGLLLKKPLKYLPETGFLKALIRLLLSTPVTSLVAGRRSWATVARFCWVN